MVRSILLIDDEPEELNAFRNALDSVGGSVRCSWAPDVEKAWVILKVERPDIVFVDDNLPGLNGLHLLSLIKSNRKLRRTKVFIYTDRIGDEIHKMARLLGASGCMEKKGTTSWLCHQFKAIFAGELLPDYILLRPRAEIPGI